MNFYVYIVFFILCLCLVMSLWQIQAANTTIRDYSTKLDQHKDLISAYDGFQNGTTSNNLFVKYGLAGVQAVVDNIATNAGTDSQLAPFFSVIDQPGHDSSAMLKAILDVQLLSLLGGPLPYPTRAFTRGVTPIGRTMADSHRGLKITDAIFTRFLNVAIVPALKTAGVSDADIAAAAPALENMRSSIVTA